MSELIEKALRTATDTKAIEFGPGAVRRVGAMFTSLFPGKKAQIVADENTFGAAGKAVRQSLRDAGVVLENPYIFPGKPTLYADYTQVEKLREFLRPRTDAAVCSIGSGTLNDIAKLASGELKRPYMNVCTAASVDGYAAFGASISRDGFKITRSCPAPAGLVADTQIIAAAPQRLTSTGYGDLIEKIPAGADWILADELGIEPIVDPVWKLVQGPLRESLARPERVGRADPQAVALLAQGNVMSGLAMQALRSSRSASGAGHQFSHVWEMEGHGLDWEPPLSHGFKVGVGTVASCALWQEALALDVNSIDVDAVVARAPSDAEVEQRVRMFLEPRIAREAVHHAVGKNLQGDRLRERIHSIQEHWDAIRQRCSAQLITPERAAEHLRAAGAPYHPEMIRIEWDRFRLTHFKAQMIRPRYTVFDLLVDLGQLTGVVNHLFSPEGYWGKHRHPQAAKRAPLADVAGGRA